MIGLGSNRLTVCRRGGMSVTQAGRGGMEWLAGGRVPLWSSPYSAQATAALKAQFPTQWPTIRDYGFAHPEIVGYMNAYAPEDAKIAYSLVEGIGTRWCYNNGTAYIQTPITVTTSTEVYIRYMIKSNNTQWPFVFGTEYTDQTSRCGTWSNGSRIAIRIGTFSQNFDQNHINIIKEISARNGKIYLDGDEKGNYSFTKAIPYGMRLFAMNNGDSSSWDGGPIDGNIYEFEIDNHKFIPFIHKDNGTDKYGMIDLLTGTFYGDATGNNGFTISETPAS